MEENNGRTTVEQLASNNVQDTLNENQELRSALAEYQQQFVALREEYMKLKTSTVFMTLDYLFKIIDNENFNKDLKGAAVEKISKIILNEYTEPEKKGDDNVTED